MAGEVRFTSHAYKRLLQRYVSRDEVEWAIVNAHVRYPGPTEGSTNIVCDMPLGRQLKVSYSMTENGDYLVITVFWTKGQP